MRSAYLSYTGVSLLPCRALYRSAWHLCELQQKFSLASWQFSEIVIRIFRPSDD